MQPIAQLPTPAPDRRSDSTTASLLEERPLGDYQRRPPPSTAAGVIALRAVPLYSMRRLVAKALAGCVRALHPEQGGPARPTPLADAVAALEENGLAMIPPVLNPSELEDMRSFLRDQVLVGYHGERFPSSEVPPHVVQASYPFPTVLRCPHVLELANRPEVLQVARAYLGCTPTLSGLRIDWSGPGTEDAVHVQQFHRDYDDWRIVKLFVYLTDVDDGSGPHEYVLRSQHGSGRLRAGAYRQEEIEAHYGPERRVRVLGPAGTSFLADTWGIHKGNLPTTRPRLMLQMQYSILPVFKFEYRPFPVPASIPYDRYVNRLMLAPQSR